MYPYIEGLFVTIKFTQSGWWWDYYHGKVSEQPFRSEMEDSNQTITFCGIGYHDQNATVEKKIQNIALWSQTMLLHANKYCPEAITTTFWAYALKAFAEKLNLLKVDYDVISLMEKFSVTTIYITIKNHHTWGSPVYLLDVRLEVNISGIPKWEP